MVAYERLSFEGLWRGFRWHRIPHQPIRVGAQPPSISSLGVLDNLDLVTTAQDRLQRNWQFRQNENGNGKEDVQCKTRPPVESGCYFVFFNVRLIHLSGNFGSIVSAVTDVIGCNRF